MAHVRVNHPISIFTDKSRPEAPNDRLVILRWKSNEKAGRKAFENRCFSVPMWSPELSGKDDKFVEMLVDSFEKRQTKIAHAYVTEILTNGYECPHIPADLLSPEQVLSDFLMEDEKDGSRGKLSGEQIGIWFTDKLSHVIMLRIADKNGWMADGHVMTGEQEKKLQQASNGYKAVLERLAAPSPKITIPMAEGLVTAIRLWEECEQDVVGKKLLKKLDGIINSESMVGELVDLL